MIRKTTMYPVATVALASLVLGACANGLHPSTDRSATKADTLYIGGDIVTLDDAQPSAQALAVKDGKTIYRRP